MSGGGAPVLDDAEFDAAIRALVVQHRDSLARMAEGPKADRAELLRGLDLAGDELRRLRRRIAWLEFRPSERDRDVAALLRRIVATDDRAAAKLAREALAVLGLPPI